MIDSLLEAGTDRCRRAAGPALHRHRRDASGGFQPVPAPLVPEHMFDGSIDGWWAVLVDES